MKIHIVDYLDKLNKEFLNEFNKPPTKLYMTINDFTELKEFLHLDYLEEFEKYHGCKVIVKQELEESYYE